MEERVSRLEGIVEQINERLGNLERGQDALRADVKAGQDSLRAEIHSNFRWTVGLILGVWVTIIAAVISGLPAR